MKAWQWILATIFVIAIGVVVFIPVHSTHGRSSAKTSCLSNLKQTALAHVMYASDFDDRLPDRDAWMDLLLPYVKHQDIYHCPESSADDNPLIYGYCFNAALSMAKLPSNGGHQIPLVFESINLARNASGYTESLPRPARHKTSSGWFNNMAYVDGHVKSIKDP